METNIAEQLQLYKSAMLDFYQDSGLEVATEDKNLKQFSELLKKNQDPFDRNCVLPGHITGSTFILNPGCDKALLTHHKKLNIWVQLGGHSEGENCSFQTAYREAQEESGIESFHTALLGAHSKIIPFDIDVHLIPETKKQKEHLHFDVRYLLKATTENFVIDHSESLQLKWFELNQLDPALKDPSVERQFKKAKLILQSGLSFTES